MGWRGCFEQLIAQTCGRAIPKNIQATTLFRNSLSGMEKKAFAPPGLKCTPIIEALGAVSITMISNAGRRASCAGKIAAAGSLPDRIYVDPDRAD